MRKELSKKDSVFLTVSLLILSLLMALCVSRIAFYTKYKIDYLNNIFEIIAAVPTFILILISACRSFTRKTLSTQNPTVFQFYILATIMASSFSAAIDINVLLIDLRYWKENLPVHFLYTVFFAVLLYFCKTHSGKSRVLLAGVIVFAGEVFYCLRLREGFLQHIIYFYFDFTRVAIVAFWCGAVLFFPALFVKKKAAPDPQLNMQVL